MGFLNSDRLIVGYDLGDERSQISYALSESGEAETLSQVAGAQVYNIPTVLCKRRGTNQWLYGREALRFAQEEDGILVENLLAMALDGEAVVIDGESFDPAALLALFFKRSLNLVSQVGPKITALMITCSTLDRRTVEVLCRVVEGAHIKADRVAFQSYAESFYNYMLRQPKELWLHTSVLFDYRKDSIRTFSMEPNRRTTPVVVFIREAEHGFQGYEEEAEEPEDTRTARQEERDAAFLRIAEETCSQSSPGSAFLIGDGFTGDWMKDSLRFLCKGRRVFQGNNLFSKGACIGMQERIVPSEPGKAYVYLGNDKLRANIGMKILRQGEESYYALLDAGANWYEAEHTMEVYLQEGNELSIMVTPLIRSSTAEGGSRLVRVILEGLPGNAARLRLHFYLKEESCLSMEVEDLGFGEFRASSGRVWREDISIA